MQRASAWQLLSAGCFLNIIEPIYSQLFYPCSVYSREQFLAIKTRQLPNEHSNIGYSLRLYANVALCVFKFCVVHIAVLPYVEKVQN